MQTAELIKSTDIDMERAIVIDAHLVKTYRACQKKYWYFNIEHIVSNRRKAAPAFGVAMHEAIAEFRNQKKAGVGYNAAVEAGTKMLGAAYKKNMPPELLQEVLQDDKRGPVNALRLFRGFCEKYEGMGYKYHQVEVPFAMYLGRVLEKDVVYVGIIDCILEDAQMLYVDDIKTTGWNISDEWLQGFRMDQGLLGYMVAARALLGVDTHHALIHAIWVQKEAKSANAKPLKDYYHVQPIYWDDEQIDEWASDTLKTIEEIEMKKVENHWVMDYGQACGAYGGCEYRSLCWSSPGVRKQLIDLDFKRAIWTPLEDERLQDVVD